MIFEIRNSWIAPAIAASAWAIQSQFAANQAIGILCQGFGHLHREAMNKVCLRVIACLLQLVNPLAGCLAHRHDLERDHIDLAPFDRSEVVGKAEPLTLLLAWEAEARQLAQLRCTRAILFLHSSWIIDDKLIAAGPTGEVAINGSRLQITQRACFP